MRPRTPFQSSGRCWVELEGESELTEEIFLKDTVKSQETHRRSGFEVGERYQGKEEKETGRCGA